MSTLPITADEIDLTRLNEAHKGSEFQVKPLYNIYEGGKQEGFALNVKPKGKKRYGNKFAPFYFSSRLEAEKACAKLNTWSLA